MADQGNEGTIEGIMGGFDPATAMGAAGDGKPAHGAVHPEMLEGKAGNGTVVADDADDTDEHLRDKSPAAPAAGKPLFRGLTKTLNTPEELAEYANELERRVIENEAKVSVYSGLGQVNGKPVAEPVKKKAYGERIFADPDGVLTELRTELKEELRGEDAKRENERAFWTSFYEENPDLAKAKKIVDYELTQNRNAWSGLSLSDAKVMLAKTARKSVQEIRDAGKPTETLRSGKAHAISAGGGGAAARQETAENNKPVSFTDQIKNMQKKRTRVG